MDITYRPVDQWPGARTPATARRRSPFKARYSETIDLLTRELAMVSARNVVIQIEADESQIRRDGLPRVDARTHGPGVIVSFDLRQAGSLSFPCDTFLRWEDNLRAIALALEALRKVDRYGVTKTAEQYRGWRKLESTPAGPGMSVEAAAHVLAEWSSYSAGVIIENAPAARSAYKQAAARTHPDVRRDDGQVFRRVVSAWEVLQSHHGVAT